MKNPKKLCSTGRSLAARTTCVFFASRFCALPTRLDGLHKQSLSFSEIVASRALGAAQLVASHASGRAARSRTMCVVEFGFTLLWTLLLVSSFSIAPFSDSFVNISSKMLLAARWVSQTERSTNPCAVAPCGTGRGTDAGNMLEECLRLCFLVHSAFLFNCAFFF